MDQKEKFSRDDCLAWLRDQYSLLLSQGETRYPARSDFSPEQVVAIKAFLGPFPRALEAAGIKPPREDDRPARNREKRIRAKRNRTLMKKEKQS